MPLTGIQPGLMRHRVTVQRHTSTVAANGQKTRDWCLHCTRWAAVTSLGGRETFRNDQLKADSTHLVELHSDEDTRAITPQMRVLWGTRELHVIRTIDRTGQNDLVRLECREPLP